MTKQIRKSHDLGHGWHAIMMTDGSMTIVNGDNQVDLDPSSVAILKAACRIRDVYEEEAAFDIDHDPENIIGRPDLGPEDNLIEGEG